MSDRELAEDQAAEWAVLLSDNPDDSALYAQFYAWLEASELNAECWQRVWRTYEGLGKLHPTTQASWPHRKHATAPATPSRRWLWAPAFALSGLLLIFAPNIFTRLETDHASSTGEVRTVILDDGSSITLAPESAIQINFTREHRRVTLHHGAAFVDVASDPNRPFSVLARDTVATALGTAFGVRHTQKGTSIGVTHGTVQVEEHSLPSLPSAQLQAGDVLSIVHRVDMHRSHEDVDEIARWRRGELIARDTPLSEVVDLLNQYRPGKTMVIGKIVHTRITGIYQLSTPQETLDALATSHGAHTTHITPWLTILSD